MKEKWVRLAVMLLSALILAGCRQEESGKTAAVTVISQGEVYIPIEDFNFIETASADPVSGKEEVLSINGGYMEVQDGWAMPRVPYDPGIRIETAAAPRNITYQLFDAQPQKAGAVQPGNPQSGTFQPEILQSEILQPEILQSGTLSSLDELSLPRPESDYIAELRMTFEEEAGISGYQYFFCVTSEEPSPKLQLSCSIKGENQQIPVEKGSGALKSLAREGKPPVLPLGSRLNLSFSDGSAPAAVQWYDMVLNNQDLSGEMLPALMKQGKEGTELPSGSLYLDVNTAAMKLAYPEAYKPGGITRGILFRCVFEDGREEYYSAALRTDAAFGLRPGDVSPAYLEAACAMRTEVFMSAEPERKKTGISLEVSLENHGERELTYGEKPVLQRYNGDQPEEIPLLEGTAWNDMAYMLEPGQKHTFTVDLEPLYGSLRPGYYRFSKELFTGTDGEEFVCSADFTVAF